MAVTISRSDVRGEMLRRAPILGRRLTADSLTKAGPSLTHLAEYARQRAGLTSFENQYIHRYNLADPDRWRLITTLNSPSNDGIINVDGLAWVNNTDLAYERLTLHPDDLNFAIAEGQRRQRVRTNIALVRGADGDMQLANTNYWGTAAALGGSSLGNCTLSKDTANAFSGSQAMLVAATGANPFTRGELIRVSPNRLAYFAAIVKVNVGPVSFQIWDNMNAVLVGSTVTQTLSLGDWTLMFIQASIPANTTVIQYQFSSTSATALWWVDTCFGPYQAGQTEYPLTSAINEVYKLRFVRPARFLSPQSIAGCYDADSMEFIGDLTHPEDWDMEVFRRDLNSNRLRFIGNSYNNRTVGWGGLLGTQFMSSNMGPIWLAMEAQASDFEPLLTETSTTGQPLDECACYSLRYVFETLNERDPDNVVWKNLLAEYKQWAVIEDMARPPQAMYTPQRYHHTLA